MSKIKRPKGNMHTIEGMAARIMDPKTSMERAVIIGRNLWRRGLAMHKQLKRIENDLARLEGDRNKSRERAKTDPAKIKRIPWRRKRRKLDEREDEAAAERAGFPVPWVWIR